MVCPADAAKYVNEVALSSKNVQTDSLNDTGVTY